MIRDQLGWHQRECKVEMLERSHGPGNVLLCELERASGVSMVCAFGQKGVPAERVAKQAAGRIRSLLKSGVPVCEHLADQLMLPMALAGTGRYLTMPLSLHSQTNQEVIRMFLDVDIDVHPLGDNRLVTIAAR